jgi:hypothetical protein
MIRYYNNRHISGHLNRIIRLAVFLLIVVLSASCEKGVLKVGGDILPNGDMVSLHPLDTISTFSYTMYDEAFRTENPTLSFLGQTFDPYFGTTTAEFVTQIRMGGKWPDTPFTVDSVRLYLRLLSASGTNSDAPHSLKISEIANQIYTDSAYYSNTPVPVTGYVIPSIPIVGLKLDTINDFMVKLPKDFGNYLLRDTSMLFYSNTKPDFRSYFKGLYFQLEQNSDPLLVSLSIAPPATLGNYYNAIVIYLHDDAGTSSIFSFILDASNKNAGFDRIIHDYSTATKGNKMIYRNTTYKDTLSYLQGINGVYTKISMPGLADLKKDTELGKIGINKAKLVVPVYFNPAENQRAISKTLPPKLQLRYKVTGGAKYDVPDYNVESTYHTFFDGALDTINKVYNFNIPAFVQAYLDDAENKVEPEVEIYQTFGLRNAVFRANASKNPVKLSITYTKF